MGKFFPDCLSPGFISEFLGRKPRRASFDPESVTPNPGEG